MKKVTLLVAVCLVAVTLLIVFSSQETVSEVEVTAVLDDVTDIEVVAVVDTASIKAEKQYIDLSGLEFEPEEVIISTSTSTTTEATKGENQQQAPSEITWSRDGSVISTDELALANDSINKLIYDINLVIELEGNYQLPGGRNMVAGDMKVASQICGFTNDLFNIDHEFQSMSAQHYCFDMFSNLMSSSIEYSDAKKTLKKIEAEMLVLLGI